MEKNWSSCFPQSFYVNESLLHKIPNIEDFEKFVFLANKYRNIFRNNFVYSAPLSYDESYSFLVNLHKDNSRIWYAISYKEEWIGHFGVRHLGNKNILLDNAIRFSSNGGKTLFKDINHALIERIRNNLYDYNILIIIKKSNTLSLKLHEEMDFKDCSKAYYEDLSIESCDFSVMILENK